MTDEDVEAGPRSGQGEEQIKAMIQEAVSAAMASQREQITRRSEKAHVTPGQFSSLGLVPASVSAIIIAPPFCFS